MEFRGEHPQRTRQHWKSRTDQRRDLQQRRPLRGWRFGTQNRAARRTCLIKVGPNGTIKTGVIQAGTVVILGTVQGDVNAQDRVEIRKDAKLTGNIKTARIIIEDGAYFKGGVDIAKVSP
jgi:hypothetical protein